jgi:hypothetical protein
MDFAVDPDLAHPARDQLRVLRAEIEDQYPVLVNVMLCHALPSLLTTNQSPITIHESRSHPSL